MFGFLFIALLTLLSVLIGSTAGAAGAGLGIYALLAIAVIWKPLGRYWLAALSTVPLTLAVTKAVAFLWPVLTSLLLAVGLVALAVLSCRPRDLS